MLGGGGASCFINAISFPYWFSLCRRIEVGIQVPCSGPKADRRRSWVRISLGPRLEHSHCSPSSEWVPEVAPFICRYQRHDGTPHCPRLPPMVKPEGPVQFYILPYPTPFLLDRKWVGNGKMKNWTGPCLVKPSKLLPAVFHMRKTKAQISCATA